MAEQTINSATGYQLIKIGDSIVSPGACTVTKDGAATKVTPRSMDVLRLLVDNAGAVVSPGEFLETIWQSPIATDHAVHKAIAELRGALKDDAHNPSFIKTIPKRGYALIASVTPCDASGNTGVAVSAENHIRKDHNSHNLTEAISTNSGLLSPTPKTSQPPLKNRVVEPTGSVWKPVTNIWSKVAIATVLSALVIVLPLISNSPVTSPNAEGVAKLVVLPFASRDFTEDNQILAEGIRESLIHGLSKLTHLQVLSPPRNPELMVVMDESGRNYLREADHVLQGSVMTSEGRLRVIVQLVRASDGLREYSDQFDLPMNDIFAVQDQIVTNVVSALRVYLNDTERSQMRDWGTTNPLAYEHFLRGEFYNNQFNPADWARAIEFHEAAIELDPNFLNAYHGLATAANNLAVYSGIDKINEMYQRVLSVHREISRIDPGSDILDSIHAIKLRMRGSNYIQQEIQLREQILSGNPPHFAMGHYALLLIGARLYDEAARFLDLASEAGPFEISPDENWSYRINVLTPSEAILARKNQLQQRPYHVSFLGSVAVNLAILGDFRQAQIYLNQQRALDHEGILTHYTEIIMGYLGGKIQPDSEAYDNAFRDHQDFYYNNGMLAFILGDVETGSLYWQNLQPEHLRRLFNVTHAAEKYFPDSVLQSADYQATLESLGAGINWQRRLMEGIMAMEPVTGVNLSRKSRDAYNSNQMMMKNNFWTELQWAEFEHHKAQRKNQASTLNTARVH